MQLENVCSEIPSPTPELGWRLMIRTDRTKRVKEARDEAKKEIDAYRKQKDDEFKKFEAEVYYPISWATHIQDCLKKVLQDIGRLC